MATRLYLPASGSPPLAALAVNANWELTNGLVRLPCFTAKQNTALATDTRLWPATATQQWCWWQFQSEPLREPYSWLATDTVSMVIGKCAETTVSGDTHLAYVVRVVSGDGSVVRGVIGLYHSTSTEYPLVASAATRIHNARTNGATAFSSQAGDRIIIEIGLHGVTPAAENIQMRKGDPSATADFALTAGLTTDLCPWVQLSRTVAFGQPVGDAAITLPDDTSSATAQVDVLGASAQTLTGDAAASTGNVLIQGSAAKTEGADAVAATAQVTDAAPSGDGAITEAADAPAGTAGVVAGASAAISEDGDVVGGAGQIVLAALSAIVEAPDAPLGTASAAIRGAGSPIEQADVPTAQAGVLLVADGAVTLAGDAALASGGVALGAAGAVTLADDVALGDAHVGSVATGDGAVLLAPDVVAATATVTGGAPPPAPEWYEEDAVTIVHRRRREMPVSVRPLIDEILEAAAQNARLESPAPDQDEDEEILWLA